MYWNKANATLDRESLEQDLQGMSFGESAIARFFGSLWEGKNTFEFDIFEDIPSCSVLRASPASSLFLKRS